MKKKRETAGKRRMRIPAFALALCLTVSAAWADAAPVLAAEETVGGNPKADTDEIVVDGVKYKKTGPGEVELTNGKVLSGDITIPGKVSDGGTEYTVVSIGINAFLNFTRLAEITLPDTITKIEYGVFKGCTGLERVALPDSLRTLAVSVFEGCTSLREIIIPEGVTQIPRNCFAGCKNLTVTLPDTVKTVHAEAFWDASDITVKCTSRRAALEAYNAGVRNILLDGTAFEPYGETAFRASEYQFAVTDDESRTVRLTQYAGGGYRNLEIPATVESPDSGLTYTITEIGDKAFMDQHELTGTLRIPDTVTEIGEHCFECCSGLTGIELPGNLKFLGKSAFVGCVGLEGNLVLPDTLTTIGSSAFRQCYSLSQIQVGKGLEQLGESAFPEGATLLACYSGRIWQLLAEGNSRLEEGTLVLLWDGKTDILAGAVVSVRDAVVVDGSVSIGEGAVVTLEPGGSLTVDGNLANNGTIAGEGGFLVNGSVVGNGRVSDGMETRFALGLSMVEGVEDSSYTGAAITPEPKVSTTFCQQEVVFEKGKDFTYRYEDNVGPGQAKVIVTPKEGGRLNGEPVARSFTIRRAGQETPSETLPPSETNQKVKVQSIRITGISGKIAAGKTIKLTAKVKPANAADKSVKWSSSKTKYATVDKKGVVKIKKAGKNKTVTITAKAADGSGAKAVYKIKIMPKAVQKIGLKASSSTVKAGKKVRLKATVTPSNKKQVNTALSFQSSNTKYAVVNGKGVVTTKKAGKGRKVKITAKATDGSNKKKTITIKIK